MYMRIIYPSTLIAIGGTALCLEQKNLGSETETGPVEQTGMRATIITKSTRERHPFGGFFSQSAGFRNLVWHIFHLLVPIRELFRELWGIRER
jgi:hypothetical protein